MNGRIRFLFTVAAFGLIFLAGCNVEQMLNQYFANLGLNRLAVPRTDMSPGAIIVVTKKGNIYYGNINKFISNPSDRFSPSNVDQDTMSQFQAVLQQYSGSSAVDGSVVLKVIDAVLPVNLSSSLKLNGQVSISQIQASGQRIEPIDIENLVNDQSKGSTIRQWLSGQWNGPDDGDIYIGYETYSAKDFKITSSNNTDISGDLTLNQTKTIGNGDIKVDVTKTSNSTLDVSGGGSYVFAVKTGKIEPRGGGWRFKITTTVPGVVKGKPEIHAVPITTEGSLELMTAQQ